MLDFNSFRNDGDFKGETRFREFCEIVLSGDREAAGKHVLDFTGSAGTGDGERAYDIMREAFKCDALAVPPAPDASHVVDGVTQIIESALDSIAEDSDADEELHAIEDAYRALRPMGERAAMRAMEYLRDRLHQEFTEEYLDACEREDSTAMARELNPSATQGQ